MTVGRIPNIEGGIQPTLLTTTGDIMYASSASNPARLGIGTASQILAVNSGATAPEWITFEAAGMTLLSSTTFTTVSSHIVNTFSSTYDAYKIICRITAASSAGNLRLRLRNNTTDETGGNYIYSAVGQLVTATGTTDNLGTGTATEFILSNLATDLTFSSFTLDMLDPFVARNTIIMGSATGRESAQNFYRAHQGSLNTNTSYNSINIYPSAGTISGNVQIYGYKK